MRNAAVSASLGVIGLVVAGGMLAGPAPGGSLCPVNAGPDVVVGVLPAIQKFGTVDGVTSYALATTSCNIGDEDLPWFGDTGQHPVIAQNMYRLKDGRFEQIGLSWVKHGFGALAGPDCCPVCENPGNFDYLGPGCSDPYSAGTNGNQAGFSGVAGLGPRSDVNPTTGVFPFPYTTQGQSGDAIYKRLQVRNDDLDPALNENALYFVEGHYVTPDDAQAGNGTNNASYRAASVGSFDRGGWDIVLEGSTMPLQPALFAWQTSDPEVLIDGVDVVGDGRLFLASRCSDNGDGTWHYEYALYNMNSNRAASGLLIDLPSGATVTNAGFHDVDHHSGEPYDTTDWAPTTTASSIGWSPIDAGANTNALRWGTTYNFRFDADAPPAAGTATIDLFLAGSPSSVQIEACGPSPGPACAGDFDRDGMVGFTDLTSLLGLWGPCPGCPQDLDGEGSVAFADLTDLLSRWGPC
jgi:hypothetical protein